MAMKMNSKSLEPLKIGVRFKQPAVILFYKRNSKFRKRVMPVRGLRKSSSVSIVASDLKEHHEDYLKDVPNFKIEKMLRLIQNDMKGLDLEESLEEIEKEFSVLPDENLNELDDVQLERKKEIMNMSFEKNQKKPGDHDYEYDIQVDFSHVTGMESSMWDSEKDDDVEF